MELFRPEKETCPVCGASGTLSVHCYYGRSLIDFIGNTAVSHDLTITRCQCSSCGSTHAILPDIIIPYSSYSLFFILRVLGEYFLHLHTIEKLCERFSITSKQLYKWVDLWREHKQQWLGFLDDLDISDQSFLYSWTSMEFPSMLTSGFVKRFAQSFLQSHANPKNATYCQVIFSPNYYFNPTT